MTAFDWITPTVAVAQDALGGPNHTFYIPDNCGRSQNKIARLLRKAGVKSWGHIAVDGDYLFTVRLDQAARAQRVLQDKRISFDNPFVPGATKDGCAWVGWLITVFCIVVVAGIFMCYATSMLGGA